MCIGFNMLVLAYSETPHHIPVVSGIPLSVAGGVLGSKLPRLYLWVC